MKSETQNINLSQNYLAILLSLIIAVISTFVIYLIDTLFRLSYLKSLLQYQGRDVSLLEIFLERHGSLENYYLSLFSPLTDFQFYLILFLLVFGFTAALLFNREERPVEEISDFRKKMVRKKQKKALKAKTRAR